VRTATHQRTEGISRGGDRGGGGDRRTNAPLLVKPKSATRISTGCEAFDQAWDQRVVNPFFPHAPSDVGSMIGQLRRKLIHALNQLVRIKANLLSHLSPLTSVNVAKAVFVANLHGEFDTLDVYLRIRENAREVVEGARRTRPAAPMSTA
jgi:hypothetical protein